MSGKFDKETLSMLGRDGVSDIQKTIIKEKSFKHLNIICPMCADRLKSGEIPDIPICNYDNFLFESDICPDCPVLWYKLRIKEEKLNALYCQNCIHSGKWWQKGNMRIGCPNGGFACLDYQEREKAIEAGEIKTVDSQVLSGDKALAHGLSPSNPAPLDSHKTTNFISAKKCPQCNGIMEIHFENENRDKYILSKIIRICFDCMHIEEVN